MAASPSGEWKRRRLDAPHCFPAVETFDQKTGRIIKVIAKSETQDDFVTFGVVGNSVGLVEREHVISFLHIRRTFSILDPLSANVVTGLWTPPVGTDHIVTKVSRTQGSPIVAAYALDATGNFE